MKRKQGGHHWARNYSTSRAAANPREPAPGRRVCDTGTCCRCRGTGPHRRLQGIDPQGTAPPRDADSITALPPDPPARTAKGHGLLAQLRIHVLFLCLRQMLQPLVYLLGCHGLGHLLTRRAKPPSAPQTSGASAWERRGGSREGRLREEKRSNFLWRSWPGKGQGWGRVGWWRAGALLRNWPDGALTLVRC